AAEDRVARCGRIRQALIEIAQLVANAQNAHLQTAEIFICRRNARCELCIRDVRLGKSRLRCRHNKRQRRDYKEKAMKSHSAAPFSLPTDAFGRDAPAF